MVKIRSRFSLRHDRTGALLFEWNPLGRVFNALASLIFLAMTLFGLSEGLSNFGALLLLLFFLPFLYNSAGNTRYRFSREEGRFSITHSFFGLHVKSTQLPISKITAITLSAIEFELHNSLHNSPHRPPQEKPGLYHLQILMNNRNDRITLESSSDRQELRASGAALGSYLLVNFESEG